MQSCVWDHALLLGPGFWGEMGVGGRVGFPCHTKRQVLTALNAARLFSASSFSWISSCSLWAEKRGYGGLGEALSLRGDVPSSCP